MAREAILIADDHPDRGAARYVLEREGYAVDVVEGVEQARALLAARVPDVLILDCQSSCADCRRMVGTLKADPRTAGMPVVAFTACARLENPCQACETAFDRTVPKGLTDQLTATLDELLHGPVA